MEVTRHALEQASREVDRTLLHWSLSLSLRERLRAATRTGRMLRGFRRVATADRR
jgi:hypothetical protein